METIWYVRRTDCLCRIVFPSYSKRRLVLRIGTGREFQLKWAESYSHACICRVTLWVFTACFKLYLCVQASDGAVDIDEALGDASLDDTADQSFQVGVTCLSIYFYLSSFYIYLSISLALPINKYVYIYMYIMRYCMYIFTQENFFKKVYQHNKQN